MYKNNGRERMEELYFIMEELLGLEYKQEAFLQILKAAETSYGLYEEQKEMKMLASSFVWQIEDYKTELRQMIDRLDTYIAQKAAIEKKKSKNGNLFQIPSQ